LADPRRTDQGRSRSALAAVSVGRLVVCRTSGIVHPSAFNQCCHVTLGDRELVATTIVTTTSVATLPR